MEYRLLGRSGLFVSALTLGTMTFGGQGGLARSAPQTSPGRKGRWTCAWTQGSTSSTPRTYTQEANPRRYSERLSPADETTYSLQRKYACPWETARTIPVSRDTT